MILYDDIIIYFHWMIHGIFILYDNISGWWLSHRSLKNMSSSVRMMTFPIEWKHNIHVPVTTNKI